MSLLRNGTSVSEGGSVFSARKPAFPGEEQQCFRERHRFEVQKSLTFQAVPTSSAKERHKCFRGRQRFQCERACLSLRSLTSSATWSLELISSSFAISRCTSGQAVREAPSASSAACRTKGAALGPEKACFSWGATVAKILPRCFNITAREILIYILGSILIYILPRCFRAREAARLPFSGVAVSRHRPPARRRNSGAVVRAREKPAFRRGVAAGIEVLPGAPPGPHRSASLRDRKDKRRSFC